jgi:integrase/recombinase XerC
MTTHAPGTTTATSAEVDAARLLLARMGLSPTDLLATPRVRPPVPTFTEYISIVSAAVTEGTRRVYGYYWNRIHDHWGHRRLDEPTPSQIKQLVEHVKVNVVARRNARGGRSAGEHLIAALRCLYRHAEDDGLIDPDPADNPASKVTKPRRLPSTRRAVAETRLGEITTPPPPPATTRHWTACCCGCTPRPPAAETAHSPCARKISTRSSA